MQRLVNFLKEVFSVPKSLRLPATYSEMTLHDAIRICRGRVQGCDVGNLPLRRSGVRPVDVCWYQSESDLYDQWNRMGHILRQAANLTVILVLGDFLRGNLREVVRWPQLAHRLVLVPHVGHWPGIDSFGDLALSAGSLGWNSIELCRDWHNASNTLPTASAPHERLLLLLPAEAPVVM